MAKAKTPTLVQTTDSEDKAQPVIGRLLEVMSPLIHAGHILDLLRSELDHAGEVDRNQVDAVAAVVAAQISSAIDRIEQTETAIRVAMGLPSLGSAHGQSDGMAQH